MDPVLANRQRRLLSDATAASIDSEGHLRAWPPAENWYVPSAAPVPARQKHLNGEDKSRPFSLMEAPEYGLPNAELYKHPVTLRTLLRVKNYHGPNIQEQTLQIVHHNLKG